jgi:hypothetical protein
MANERAIFDASSFSRRLELTSECRPSPLEVIAKSIRYGLFTGKAAVNSFGEYDPGEKAMGPPCRGVG